MRELIKYTLFALIVIAISCKKQKEAPVQTADYNATSLSPQEQSLLGHWTLDSVIQYNFTSRLSSYHPSNTGMNLGGASSIAGCMAPDTAYSYTYFGATSSKGQWSAKQNNLIMLSAPYVSKFTFILSTPNVYKCVNTLTISSLNSSSLVLKASGNSNSIPKLAYYYYYHR